MYTPIYKYLNSIFEIHLKLYDKISANILIIAAVVVKLGRS